MTAPLQLLALTFRLGADAESRLLAEVDRIQGRGALRVLDVGFLAKRAAAAAAVSALIAAGLVEEAAAHEAVTALTAAGLITDAADQAAAQAVAEDLALIGAADEVAAEATEESEAATPDAQPGRGGQPRTHVRATAPVNETGGHRQDE